MAFDGCLDEEDYEDVDLLIHAMETALRRVNEMQGSKVRLPKAEFDLLECFGCLRDLMMDVLHAGHTDRSELQLLFGGDCERISRIFVVLEKAMETLTPTNANDPRVKTCHSACLSVERVLDDLGLGSRLRRAHEKAKRMLEEGYLQRLCEERASVMIPAADKSIEMACVAGTFDEAGQVFEAVLEGNATESCKGAYNQNDKCQAGVASEPPCPSMVSKLAGAADVLKSLEKPSQAPTHYKHVAEPSPEPPPAKESPVVVDAVVEKPARLVDEGQCATEKTSLQRAVRLDDVVDAVVGKPARQVDEGQCATEKTSLQPAKPSERQHTPVRSTADNRRPRTPVRGAARAQPEVVDQAAQGTQSSPEAVRSKPKPRSGKSVDARASPSTVTKEDCRPEEASPRRSKSSTFGNARGQAAMRGQRSSTRESTASTPSTPSLGLSPPASPKEPAAEKRKSRVSRASWQDIDVSDEDTSFDVLRLLPVGHADLIRELFAYYSGTSSGGGLSVARFRRFLRDAGLLAETSDATSGGSDGTGGFGEVDLSGDRGRGSRATIGNFGRNATLGAAFMETGTTHSPVSRASQVENPRFNFSMADRIRAAMEDSAAPPSSRATLCATPGAMSCGSMSARSLNEPPIAKTVHADLILVKAAGHIGEEQQNSPKLPTPEALATALLIVARRCYPDAEGPAMALQNLVTDVLEPLEARLPVAPRTAVQRAVALMANDADLGTLLQRTRGALTPLFSHAASGTHAGAAKAYWTLQAASRLVFEANLVAQISRPILQQLFREVTNYEAIALRGVEGKLTFLGFQVLLVVISEHVHKTMRQTPRDRLAALLIRLSSSKVEGAKELRKITAQLSTTTCKSLSPRRQSRGTISSSRRSMSKTG